ncbi:hypothetical protein MCOR27_004658 [Pyricularia oryzae]|uniref:DUF7603 domain-containing protein n=2 Tax=Pyricularia TaxID=48558 RepID=A0ABQ8NM93_PYRGI|nr:hypothetical protein MCOR01_011087 [Pyricularia oryzae]KAI6299065.1 hypothetical protein MCOR33_004932 [Pyricularia grisea]KAH9437850.1 hypothetical protein MCOR02_001496 [Pyricularia oryzae]KAI6261986.1 hypothetical protein MCOR19_001800 [Pyricularia oryzae]KAI6280072.1 hypothetical protein MCOR26_003877 [Pyricularia oryzae]
MAVNNPPARGHPPETSPASASSEKSMRPSSHAAAVTTPELPSPRNFRSQSLAHHDRSPRVVTTAPIKRKPLSASASPLARRFSQSSQYSQPSQYAPSPPPQHYLDILDELPSPPLMLDQLANRTSRSYSIDSPTIYDFPSAKVAPLMPLVPEAGRIDKFPGVPAAGPETGSQDWDDAQSELRRNIPDLNPAVLQTQNDPTSAFQIQGFIPNEQDFDVISIRGASQLHQEDSEQVDVDPALHSKQLGDQASSNINATQPNRMSLFSRKPSPPHLKLANTKEFSEQKSIAFDSTTALIADQPSDLVPLALAPAPVAAETENATTNKQDPVTHNSVIAPSNQTSDNLNANKPLPPLKSPASSRLGSFFGWTTSSPASTSFSDKGFSPLPSPFSQRTTTVYTDDTPASAKTEPLTAKAAVHASLSNQTTPLEYCEDYLQTPPTTTTPSPASQIEDMEDELKAISAELAASIRREMDLEDLVERLQSQVGSRGEPGKRTSDYFSDSGYSSAKASEADASREEVAHVQRRAEQEKAQVRLELSQKLNDERSRRRELDLQIKELSLRASRMGEEQAQRGSMSDNNNDRVKELESSCEELRRRLSEEREVKDNFQDLLDALKGELQSAANERDNLRDEVVPQLRARVEGLEQQAAEYSKSTYESTKIQQELQTLQEENASLRALKQNRESQRFEPNQTRMSRIARSSSVSTVNSTFKLQQAPLGRSNTVKGPQGQQFESREAMSERLKDVEAQRDALHSALKNLLERQEFQNRENEKKIRVLEQERTRLLASSPKKAGYERDVSNLKEEIAVLRKRAEDAVEQKWQVEKGLAGLKMDLDRAEEEIAGLKSLLRENDILIPAAFARPMSSPDSIDGDVTPVTSASLQKAYQDLRSSYAQALERIKKLELSSVENDALNKLEAAVAADGSQPSQASFEAQVKEYLETERDLADQLQASARRVEELAAQVQAQLAINATLRTRLTDAVTRGEANQQTSKERITGLQRRLKELEDELSSTQSAAEDRVARHEEEIKQLREANNGQIQRLRDAAGGLRSPLPKSPGLRSPTQRLFPPRSPLSPLFANGARSPRFANSPVSRPGSSGPNSARSLKSPGMAGEEDQTAQVEKLRRRVAELEKALNEADAEMQEVVGRMNGAQIEVLQLQEEREQAIRETRRLQRQIDEERVKVFEDRFRDLSASAMA